MESNGELDIQQILSPLLKYPHNQFDEYGQNHNHYYDHDRRQTSEKLWRVIIKLNKSICKELLHLPKKSSSNGCSTNDAESV